MDEYTHVALLLEQAVNEDLAALAARIAAWTPAPMPKDWR